MVEPAKNPQRTPFERDRARVLHSSALRRLGAKTQVLGPGSDDFVRTRLTHSLEVAQVGRALGQALGCDPDVVDTACLAHDLGHPPYGHNGEKALDVIAAPIGGFEGNAQTLRLLTRLEPKTLTPSGRSVGLNLTRASLDVGYSVHDVEDAIALGRMDPALLRRPGEAGAVVEATLNWYGREADAAALEAAWQRLTALPCWIGSYTGSPADAAALKNLTSQLIGRFVSAVADATRRAFGRGPLTRYDADLVIPEDTAAEILVLKGAAVRYVMAPREHEPVYLRQRTDLADALVGSGDRHLEPIFADAWRRADDDAGRLRAVVDQIASLTDTSARTWHARLCGLLSQV